MIKPERDRFRAGYAISLVALMILGGQFAAGVAQGQSLNNRQIQSQVETASFRRLIKLKEGETVNLYGIDYTARKSTLAILSVSSELVTFVVISGAVISSADVSGQLTQDRLLAHEGEALVTPIDAKSTVLFGYDAQRLAVSLPPSWADDAGAPLQHLIKQQKRLKFWGLIEPVGINASAPVSPQIESVRQSYLGNETIINLRRAALGNPQTLSVLTVKRFAEAISLGDAQSVANLIDPKPFTDSGADAQGWQSARLSFAQNLIKDEALMRAMSDMTKASQGESQAGGAFKVQLVMRDRAMFVSAVEPNLSSKEPVQ